MSRSASRSSVRELALAYLMALAAFGYFAGTWQDANTYSRLSLVRSLAVEHRAAIDTTQVDEAFRAMRTGDRSFYNGHYYSDKAIGSSLIGAMLWAPVHWLPRQRTPSVRRARVHRHGYVSRRERPLRSARAARLRVRR